MQSTPRDRRRLASYEARKMNWRPAPFSRLSHFRTEQKLRWGNQLFLIKCISSQKCQFSAHWPSALTYFLKTDRSEVVPGGNKLLTQTHPYPGRREHSHTMFSPASVRVHDLPSYSLRTQKTKLVTQPNTRTQQHVLNVIEFARSDGSRQFLKFLT